MGEGKGLNLAQQQSSIHIADNDFLIKLARWDLLDKFLLSQKTTTRQIRVIPTLRARTGIGSNNPNVRLLGNAVAARRLHDFLINAGLVRPIDQNFMAAASGLLDLDGGEVTLLAGLCAGGGDFFYTGDKRAIRALKQFVGSPFDPMLRGKVVCLEQVLYHLISLNGTGLVLHSIADDLGADPGISNLLVGGAQTPEARFKTSLESACRDLYSESGQLLAPYP